MEEWKKKIKAIFSSAGGKEKSLRFAVDWTKILKSWFARVNNPSLKRGAFHGGGGVLAPQVVY